MYGDLKLTFTQNCLNEYMQRVADAMRLQANRLKVGVTDEGINSIAWQVIQSGGGTFGNLKFKEYLRFVDMGVGRGHPLGGLTSMKITLQSSSKNGMAQVKDKTRKAKKIYSPVVYGGLNHLIGKLSYGFTEETIALLKQNMQDGNTIA